MTAPLRKVRLHSSPQRRTLFSDLAAALEWFAIHGWVIAIAATVLFLIWAIPLIQAAADAALRCAAGR